jgi:hypothetical protein
MAVTAGPVSVQDQFDDAGVLLKPNRVRADDKRERGSGANNDPQREVVAGQALRLLGC